MANPSISFTDGDGAASLTLLVPRLQNWLPDVLPVDDSEVTLADGSIVQYRYRTDYVASFEVPNLRPADLEVALRLKAWLLAGGTATVNTEDLASRSYTVGLQPQTKPELSFTDRVALEYTLRLQVVNRGESPGPMLCEYE